MFRADQSGKPAQQTREFRVGERVFAIVALVAVPASLELGHVWVKNEGGGRVTPVAKPSLARVEPSMQGNTGTFALDGLPAGDYLFIVFLPGSGEQAQLVAKAEFVVR